MRKTIAFAFFGVAAAAVVAVYAWTKWNGPNRPGADAPAKPSVSTRPTPPSNTEKPGKMVHPLLGEADDVVVCEGIDEVSSTADAKLSELIRAVAAAPAEGNAALVTFDYPRDES
ncbi:MAG: hypothetical protein ACYTG0_10815, partial [Planctomycetota bacterium]